MPNSNQFAFSNSHLSRRLSRSLLVIATALLAVAFTGCVGPAASGTFDKSLTVGGPVQLELHGGSGRVEIRTGSANQVRVHGEYEIWGFGFESAQHEAEDIAAHPPVDQRGDTIKIGSDVERFSGASIKYTIYVPQQTEARITVGSGGVEIAGIDGPVDVSAGSGHVSIHGVRRDVRLGTSSGGADLEDVDGRVNVIGRSGSISLTQIGGDVVAEASSGHLGIFHARGRVEAHGGSGGVEINGITSELRATSSSGRISVSGDPSPNAFWDIRTGSGSVTLDSTSSASYRLYAHSSSGGVHTSVPISLEETQGRHAVRGRVGDGAARVEIETRSGSITVH